MIKMRIGGLCVAFTLLLAPVYSFAQTNLGEVVKQTITNNPEVLASWEAFQESTHEQRAAAGGFLPRIDLFSRVGHEDNQYPSTSESYRPAEASLSLRQLVFDGFATRNEVDRLDFHKRARYYDVLQTSEDAALEAVRAYVDVLRFRELLDYANQNYLEHQQIYQQVKERVDSGVGRGVDLEQATGRLALAESNRITESNNLHDVTARFLRIVGELPDETLTPLPALTSLELPANTESALREAFESNPGFKATFENVRASAKARDARESEYMPKVEAKAYYDIGADRNEIDGHSEKGVVELNLTYNLYRGGSDIAAVRQYNSRLNRSRKLREKACHNLRQTISIAYTERQLLESQLGSLKLHEESIANARTAYRKQFDIGQRTLLDLLDSENEYFRARRAHTLSSYDYFLAHTKTLAGMGQLLTTIGVRQDNLPDISELGGTADDIDPTQICPVEEVPESLYMWKAVSESGEESNDTAKKEPVIPAPRAQFEEKDVESTGLAEPYKKAAPSRETTAVSATQIAPNNEVIQWSTPLPRRGVSHTHDQENILASN